MIPAGTRVYIATEPADLRRSFDGLAATTLERLGRDPGEGGLFVFMNRRGNQVRVLFRDPHGWCILAKRLDRGRFRARAFEEGCPCWETNAQALLQFLDDIVAPSRGGSRSRAKRALTIVQS